MSIKPWICNGSRTIVKDRWIDLHADAGALRGVIRGLTAHCRMARRSLRFM